MTRRERLERKVERREQWAESAQRQAEMRISTARGMAEAIPFGQPILIGHHSERRDRNYRERIRGNFEKGFEAMNRAKEHESKAAGLSAQLDGAIYMDDPDVIERLTAKLAELEAQRERMKAENAAYRKGDEAFAACMGITVEQAAALRAQIETGYSWCRQPHPSYSLQNLGGTITKERKRLEIAKAAKTPRGTATVETTGETATARAGLTVIATQTTPAKAWKKPRPVWNVSGNLAYWRPLLERIGGSWYRGVVSFWEDPTADIETALLEAETENASV